MVAKLYFIASLLVFCNTVIGQPLDTLIHDYTYVLDITALEDNTFIIIGDKEGAVKVSRIDDKTSIIWTRTLTDSLFYEVRDYEVRVFDVDSSIMIITHKTTCDILPPGTAYLYTLDFKGNIKDTVAIPFESYEQMFLLSGSDSLPRCATIEGDSVILKYAHTNDRIIDDFPKGLKPDLVDMSPYGELLIQIDIGSLHFYNFINNSWTYTFNGFGHPGADQMICVDHNHLIFTYSEYISVMDPISFHNISIYEENGFFSNIKWKPPYIYFHLGEFDSDSFYVTDLNLNPVISKDNRGPKNISDILIHSDELFILGHDSYLPYPNAYIESEDLLAHTGPKFYDVELISYQAGVADSFILDNKCGPFFYMYYYPEILATVRNNGDYPVSETTIGYYDSWSHCCSHAIWEKRITEMNLLPGETKEFIIPDFYVPRVYPFEGPFDWCISISVPDNHPDDIPDNNEACFRGLSTATIETDQSKSLNPYPNPTPDLVYFNIANDEAHEVSLYDISGTLVLKKTVHNHNPVLELGDVVSGLYFIYSSSSSGINYSSKLIKL